VAPNVFFRARPTKLPPDEARRRLDDALGAAFPAAGMAVRLEDGVPVVAWEDGPAGMQVADVTGSVVNWEVRSLGLRPGRAGAPAVLLDRAFSAPALAVAVIRHQASHVRPFSSTDERAVADLSALLETDDPARSGYPVVDAMAALLLEAPEPDDLAVPEGATPADRMAAKLTALGYDALWAVAWKGIA
jgi:hypothetical protein